MPPRHPARARQRPVADHRDRAPLEVGAQVVGERRRAGVAGGRVGRERAGGDRLELRRDARVARPRQLDFAAAGPVEDQERRVARHGRLPREHAREHGAEREHVGRRADVLPPRLLGRHEAERAQERALLREGARPLEQRGELGPDRLVLLARLAQVAREAPVHHQHLAEGADHDVLGLEVAVDHALAVRVGHRLRHLHERLEEVARLARPPPPPLEGGRQRAAVDRAHEQVVLIDRRRARLVDRRDPGMVEPGRDHDLAPEAAHPHGARLALHQLERRQAPEARVAHEVDDPHAPLAQHPLARDDEPGPERDRVTHPVGPLAPGGLAVEHRRRPVRVARARLGHGQGAGRRAAPRRLELGPEPREGLGAEEPLRHEEVRQGPPVPARPRGEGLPQPVLGDEPPAHEQAQEDRLVEHRDEHGRPGSPPPGNLGPASGVPSACPRRKILVTVR
ncbi:MAG: hypothetical protein M9894_02210 [Planctomycetes bacterium]|nr:hypothetical protein [Planctomycetota bacterium]